MGCLHLVEEGWPRAYST